MRNLCNFRRIWEFLISGRVYSKAKYYCQAMVSLFLSLPLPVSLSPCSSSCFLLCICSQWCALHGSRHGYQHFRLTTLSPLCKPSLEMERKPFFSASRRKGPRCDSLVSAARSPMSSHQSGVQVSPNQPKGRKGVLSRPHSRRPHQILTAFCTCAVKKLVDVTQKTEVSDHTHRVLSTWIFHILYMTQSRDSQENSIKE